MSKEKILSDYKSSQEIFNAFGGRISNLISDLLKRENLVIHQITNRTKDLDSLSKKIDKKIDHYSKITDITDIVGIRIITYLESDVDDVANIIKREFSIDESNSIDKRLLKVDQFGYRSLHIVANLNQQRCDLPEYKEYSTIKCEIQIRSVLQHAWAEIEHDLGYKGNNVPDEFKRTFNRLAALLETADIEFVNLKKSLSKYERNVPELIKNEPEVVDINKASILSFLDTNKIILKAIKMIENLTGFETNKKYIDLLVPLLTYCNINTIKDLEKSLADNEKFYLSFIENFIKYREIKEELSHGVSLLYLSHFLMAKTKDITIIGNYLDKNFTILDSRDHAQKYIELFDKSTS
jgi:putative GTP pyrophosphokinase